MISQTYNKFDEKSLFLLDNFTKAVYICDVAALKISAKSVLNTNLGFNFMNNINLQSKIACQYEDKNTIIANKHIKEFVWDPTAGQATIPLVFKLVQNNETFFYTQDANKNIVELVFADTVKGVAAHYEYDAFGAIITTNFSLSISNTSAENIASLNPFKFSSEYHDSTLGLVYYNYRHYNPNDGRWLSRDPIAEKSGYNLYGMCENNLLSLSDVLGRTAIAIGAGVCTVICPGPGTLIGIGVGAVITVGVIVIYHFKCETKTDATDIVIPTTQCSKKGECNPCIPPAGTISTHRIDLTGAAHNGIPTPHSHMKFVNQSPYPFCTCHWNKFDSNTPFEDAIKPLYNTKIPPGGDSRI